MCPIKYLSDSNQIELILWLRKILIYGMNDRLLNLVSMWTIALGNKFLWNCDLNLLFASNDNKRWNVIHIYTRTKDKKCGEYLAPLAFYKNSLVLFSQNKFHCTNITVQCNYWMTDGSYHKNSILFESGC